MRKLKVSDLRSLRDKVWERFPLTPKNTHILCNVEVKLRMCQWRMGEDLGQYDPETPLTPGAREIFFNLALWLLSLEYDLGFSEEGG